MKSIYSNLLPFVTKKEVKAKKEYLDSKKESNLESLKLKEDNLTIEELSYENTYI